MLGRQFLSKMTMVGALLVNGWMLVPQVSAQSKFKDVDGHWAQACIEQLANRQIIGGYRDGTFRPGEAMTRVEFVVFLDKAFPNSAPVRDRVDFIDIPTDYWALPAIERMYRANFLTGYSENIFNPTQKILRLQALLALVSGLRYSADSGEVEQVKSAFSDGAEIPEYALKQIAAATQRRIVVNYPDSNQLNPQKEATRAEVAAMVCQALNQGTSGLISEQYIAKLTPASGVTTTPTAMTKTQVAELGNIRAEFSYQPLENSDISKNLRLKIFRSNQVVLDEPVLVSTKSSQNGAENRQSEGRLFNIIIRDIDRDGEPEIILDLLSAINRDGCCTYTYIYGYEPTLNKYSRLEVSWANIAYQVRDLENDGIIEFESGDYRLGSALDLAPSDARYPRRIWQYRQGKMIDVTRQYPQFVYEHAKQMWQEFQERRSQNREVRGILAAYLGDKYLIGEEEEAWALIEKVYQAADAPQYFQTLRRFYQDAGYKN